MGCASSTPMVQTAGSDMLKAATHVADDATKTAEEAVQGVKGTVEKTLETAKETVATKVEEVKQEVEHTLKEQAQHLDDAKNSLMGKLHLGTNAVEKTADDAKNAVATMKDDIANTAEAETKKLTETLKNSTETMASSSGDTTSDEANTVRLARADTETDSLRTSTPEPEIERALANSKTNSVESDGKDKSPPTPTPTFSELENLSNELLNQQHKTVSDPLMMADNTTTNAKVSDMTGSNSTSNVTTDNHANAMHIAPIANASTIATAIAASTASTLQFNWDTPPPSPTTIAAQAAAAAAEALANVQPIKSKAAKREEIRLRQLKMIERLQDEKRPGTTEWEKYADMLALFRKFNPHDAFRSRAHGSHLGGAAIRERGLHGRADDDSSDTTSNWGKGSPARRSSARAGGRLHRPNSANQRVANGGAISRRNSNANIANGGRKFDFNPSRTRLTDPRGSSVSYGQKFSNLPTTTTTAYRLSPSFGTQSPKHAHHVSVKSPSNMRSKLSPLGSNSTQRSDARGQRQHEYTAGQQQQYQRHISSSNKSPALSPGGSSMPLDAMLSNNYNIHALTRESSNNSLSSRSTYQGHIRSCKSSLDLRTAGPLTPVHQHVHHQSVRNTSSFLSTPRTSPFSITKSYTDLYFSSRSDKENFGPFQADLSSIAKQRQLRDKSPYKIRDRCEVCCKKYIKT